MVKYCNEHDLAMIELRDPATEVMILMVAPVNSISAESAAIVSAHMLLSGIVTRGFQNAADELAKTDSTIN